MNSINVNNPLSDPYPTGSYLIFDDLDGTDNFRNAMLLTEQPYRASGSHQMNIAGFINYLKPVARVEDPTRLFLVDLREEAHGFVDTDTAAGHGAAVSWYADNDWSNVGRSSKWIEADERQRMRMLATERDARIFQTTTDLYDNRAQDRVLPLAYMDAEIVDAYTESYAASVIGASLGPPVEYVRLTVTDHCAPSTASLIAIEELARRVGPTDWVHFHCHGGDGRTTTFLALWDMLQWQGPLPPLEKFSARQCALFTYCLDPDPSAQLSALDCEPETAPWKEPLAEQRWLALERFRRNLQAGRDIAEERPETLDSAAEKIKKGLST